MLQLDQESYRGTPAYYAATAMPVILENGRKVFGPPPNFTDVPPSCRCELYVKRIPQHLDELGLLVWLHRIGRVYKFRLMMDSAKFSRGYAFIRFCNENDALSAFELLKYLFVSQDRLSVFRSQGKSRFFVSGIPREIPLDQLENNFRLCFPQMQKCSVFAARKQNIDKLRRESDLNRGFAFIEFTDHETALESKKQVTPGNVRMWGVDIKVQWAKPLQKSKQDANGTWRTYGYDGNRIQLHAYFLNDFCAKLRHYCLANNLCIPIVVYGQSFRPHQLQYAGILLKNNSLGLHSMFIFEIMVGGMSDIHMLVCELAVNQMERHSGQLNHHAIFRVLNNTKAELVCEFQNPQQLDWLNMRNIFKSVQSIEGLAISLELLARQNTEKLLTLYKSSFLISQSVASFDIATENRYGRFYSILPKFRNNPKLNNNFNDMEINLLQAQFANTLEFETPRSDDTAARSSKDPKNIEHLILKSQNDYSTIYRLCYVDLMGLQTRECYHPAQRLNTNPLWIAGQSYQKSIYN